MHAPEAKLIKELQVKVLTINELSRETCRYDGNVVLIDGVKLIVKVVAVSRILSVKTPEIAEKDVGTEFDRLSVKVPAEYFETLLAVFV